MPRRGDVEVLQEPYLENSPSPRPLVLVVDDEPALREVLSFGSRAGDTAFRRV